MNIQQAKDKCAHAACACTVEPGQLYCSTYCAEAAASPDSAVHAVCRCGHPDCEERASGSTR